MVGISWFQNYDLLGRSISWSAHAQERLLCRRATMQLWPKWREDSGLLTDKSTLLVRAQICLLRALMKRFSHIRKVWEPWSRWRSNWKQKNFQRLWTLALSFVDSIPYSFFLFSFIFWICFKLSVFPKVPKLKPIVCRNQQAMKIMWMQNYLNLENKGKWMRVFSTSI